MKRTAAVLGLLFVSLVAARLCHSGIVWIEEAYPAAAAIQLLHGKAIYRDFWFDKPPLTAWFYLLWGAHTGIPLRIAGALLAFACCLVAYRFATRLWSPREGLAAALAVGFFLTFDFPSAVMAIAPDLFTLLPHLAAVYLAWRRRAFAAGLLAGAGMLANPKAFLLIPVCLLWCWREWLRVGAGFVVATAVLLATVPLGGYYREVWQWGSLYAKDTFVEHPLADGLRRTAAWLGFHAALNLPAGYYYWRERSPDARRFAAWTAITFIGVVLGWRFFPRYYFLLLPAVVIPAARGFLLLPKRARVAVASLLLVPLVRFGPRYISLAAGADPNWSDIAMNQDSRAVSSLLTSAAPPGATLLVWGYRPDIFMYTRFAAGTPFLDSQPLTGVIADRHLTHSEPSAPELAAHNRARLTQYTPTFIVDGLGPYNPSLAITQYPDLRRWLDHYREIARTRTSVIYQVRGAPAPIPAP